MSYTGTNPVSIGNPTKKSDYDTLWDNVVAVKAEVETEHNSDGTHKTESGTMAAYVDAGDASAETTAWFFATTL